MPRLTAKRLPDAKALYQTFGNRERQEWHRRGEPAGADALAEIREFVDAKRAAANASRAVLTFNQLRGL